MVEEQALVFIAFLLPSVENPGVEMGWLPLLTKQKASQGAWRAAKARGEVGRNQTKAGFLALQAICILLIMWREAAGGC